MDHNIIKGKATLTNTGDVFIGSVSVNDSEYVNNGIYMCKMSATNTTTSPTLNLNLIGAKVIKNNGNVALTVGSLVANGWYLFMYDLTNDVFQSLNEIEPIIVRNTVFVDKNGSDSSGLVERQDRPFLTPSAAAIAADAYFTSRTQYSRVLINVATGYYTDTLPLYDFIDYDLGDSVVYASYGNRVIYDGGRTFSTTINNGPNCIIYGNAQIIDDQSSYATIEITSNLRLHVYCSTVYSENRKAILMRTGFLRITCSSIYMSTNNSYNTQTIELACSNIVTWPVAPTLEIYGAKIYTNPAGSINATISIYNGIYGSNHQTDYQKISLIDCEVGNWSQLASGTLNGRGVISASGAPSGGTSIIGPYVSLAQITLKNTIIYSLNNPSIEDNYHVTNYPYNVFKVYGYGGYANKAMVLAAPTSALLVGAVTIDTDVIINQGISL